MKALFILLFTLIYTIGSAQAILYSNPSYDTRHLKASMNPTQDTITLTSEKGIQEIIYWNYEDHNSRVAKTYNKDTVSVPIGHLPPAEYTFLVMSGTRIIMSLVVPDIRIDGTGEHKINQRALVEPKDTIPAKLQKTIIHIPYNVTTTRIRRDERLSDTIYVKESREAYIRRMDSLQGKRLELKFEKQ